MQNACVYCLAIDGEVQRLADLAQHHGWTVAHTVIEQPTTAPDRRVNLHAIRRMLATGGTDALVVPSLAMFGSLHETISLFAKLVERRIHIIAEVEKIDSTTGEGWAHVSGVAALDGFQRALRQQKARAGQLRAKEAGVRFGRPPIPESTMLKVRMALAEDGAGIRHVARKTGVSPARVLTEKRAMEAVGSSL